MNSVAGVVFGSKHTQAQHKRNLSSFLNKVQTGVMSTVMRRL
jgi:hypothetical protein